MDISGGIIGIFLGALYGYIWGHYRDSSGGIIWILSGGIIAIYLGAL